MSLIDSEKLFELFDSLDIRYGKYPDFPFFGKEMKLEVSLHLKDLVVSKEECKEKYKCDL